MMESKVLKMLGENLKINVEVSNTSSFVNLKVSLEYKGEEVCSDSAILPISNDVSN